MRVLIDSETTGRGIRRMAGEIVERGGGAKNLALVGIRRGGVPIAARLAAHIDELEGIGVPVGAVDIAIDPDGASTSLPNPQIGRNHIPYNVDRHRIGL